MTENEIFAARIDPSVSFRLTLPMPHKYLSPNACVHWAPKSKAIKAARLNSKRTTQKALVSAGITTPPHWKEAHYSLVFYCKTAARRDDDNLKASCKAYRDGIADAGLVADDYVMREKGCEIKKDANNPRCEITIWEVIQ